MLRVIIGLAAAGLVAVGCGTTNRDQEAPTGNAARPDGATQAQTLAGRPDRDAVGDPCDSGEGYRAGSSADVRDRGVGVLTLVDSIVGRRGDTVVVHADRSPSAPVVARYILRHIPDYSWCYRLEVYEPNLTDNSLEVGYETTGLPLAQLDRAGGWARVIYGFSQERRALTGWVSLNETSHRAVTWPEHFEAMNGFLWADGKTPPDFRSAPDGAPVDLGIAPDDNGNFHFEVEILALEGRWLKADVRFPSLCVADSVTHEGVVWFRYLTETGRPAVWYATRGC